MRCECRPGTDQCDHCTEMYEQGRRHQLADITSILKDYVCSKCQAGFTPKHRDCEEYEDLIKILNTPE